MFFLQMSGFPGSGKSTVARRVAKHTGAVIIDHDVVKTALMEAMNESENNRASGGIAYHIEWSLISYHLGQGHSVIHDCPCFYEPMVAQGAELSHKHGAAFKYVECYLDNMDEINYRLKNRERMISQITEIQSEEGFRKRIADSKRPPDTDYLVVDTSRPVDDYIDEVLQYISKS